MKINISVLTMALAFLVLSCSTGENKINTLSKKEKAKGWELLFDGQSIDKWKMFNGGEVTGWKVVNGEMRNSGTDANYGGDIVTKKQYGDFELYLEWKISPQSRSGIFYHVEEGISDNMGETAPEYPIIDEKGWLGQLEDWQKTGANYGINPPEGAKQKAVNKWNSTRIIVKNPHVEHWLNGEMVVAYELWDDQWKTGKEAAKWKISPAYGEAKSGSVGLEDHGGFIAFRNIKIREL